MMQPDPYDEEDQEELLRFQIAHGIYRCAPGCEDPGHADVRARRDAADAAAWRQHASGGEILPAVENEDRLGPFILSEGGPIGDARTTDQVKQRQRDRMREIGTKVVVGVCIGALMLFAFWLIGWIVLTALDAIASAVS